MKSNNQLTNLINELKKKSLDEKVNIWKRIASDLEKPTRKRRVVNLNRAEAKTKADETVIVPGKVLGSGELNHKLTVAAYSFSKSALEKINRAGKAITINELMKTNPKGSKVRIIG